MAEKIKKPNDKKSSNPSFSRNIDITSSISSINSLNKDLKTELIGLIEYSKEIDNVTAQVMNYRKLLEICDKNSQEYQDHQNHFSNICSELKERNLQKKKEEDRIRKNLTKLQEIINIEEDISSEIETITLSDLKVNKSELNDMVEVANQVLLSKKTQKVKCIENSAIFVTESGKSIPLKAASHIGRNFQKINHHLDTNSELNKLPNDIYTEMEYDLSELSKDPIEEAFIEDIIPYDYEIKEILINNKIPKQPQKHYAKNGLHLGWNVKNIKELSSFSIKYHLRPRVSRTIILPHENEVDIIRTYSNLHDDNQHDFSYQTNLVFNNNFEQEIDSVVMEDLIPQSYLYHVEEYKSGFFPSSKETTESFIKWKIFHLPEKESTNHTYELTEINTVEEIKIEAYHLLKIELSKLSPQTRKMIEKKQNEAKKFLERFQ